MIGHKVGVTGTGKQKHPQKKTEQESLDIQEPTLNLEEDQR